MASTVYSLSVQPTLNSNKLKSYRREKLGQMSLYKLEWLLKPDQIFFFPARPVATNFPTYNLSKSRTLNTIEVLLDAILNTLIEKPFQAI